VTRVQRMPGKGVTAGRGFQGQIIGCGWDQVKQQCVDRTTEEGIKIEIKRETCSEKKITSPAISVLNPIRKTVK